jgi:hypothetical protein
MSREKLDLKSAVWTSILPVFRSRINLDGYNEISRVLDPENSQKGN